MTVAAFISSQRADHDVPVTLACRALGVSASWFYKWRDRPPTPRQDRHAELVEAVWESFRASGFVYGSPRVWLDLLQAGWRVSVNTVAAVMAEHGWAGRKAPRRRSLTRQGSRAAAPDLVGRKFWAAKPDQLWCGDVTYIDTGQGWLYLATVLDLCSRRLLGYAMGAHHDAALTEAGGRRRKGARIPWTPPTRPAPSIPPPARASACRCSAGTSRWPSVLATNT